MAEETVVDGDEEPEQGDKKPTGPFFEPLLKKKPNQPLC